LQKPLNVGGIVGALVDVGKWVGETVGFRVGVAVGGGATVGTGAVVGFDGVVAACWSDVLILCETSTKEARQSKLHESAVAHCSTYFPSASKRAIEIGGHLAQPKSIESIMEFASTGIPPSHFS
jgi:hypothetical protein